MCRGDDADRTHRISKSERDVQNEKPRNVNARKQEEQKAAETGTSAIIHTTYGDIHIRLFPEAAPKAVENFVVHSRNGYYNNVIFHRVIRKFMIQVRARACLKGPPCSGSRANHIADWRSSWRRDRRREHLG